ncbi:MAG TPA: hypothetical protein VLI39_19545 [Sedimentisphaerales bacterium]|nr:hypothetical protein [Sedimentisphaerales bacterium]
MAKSASVYIEWSDGFSVEFLVRFGQEESHTITGLGLIDIIEAQTELPTVHEHSAGEHRIWGLCSVAGFADSPSR